MHFRIEDTIEDRGDLPENTGDGYTESATDINIRGMLEHVSEEMEQYLPEIYNNALSSELWSDDYVNLLSLENFQSCFEPLTGSIKTSLRFENSVINNFYSLGERSYIRNGFRETRAKSYYIAVDPDYISNHEKLAIIQRDLEDCYATLQLISRDSLQGQDYLGYLGILDHIKQHTLCLFHVLTYPERFGNFTANDEYLRFRNIAIELININTKAFYQGCLGQRFDSGFGSIDHLAKLKELVMFVSTLERDYRQYTLQEVDHPIRMMVHVNQLLRMYPDTNTIIPILSGGTQAALLVKEGLKLQKTQELPVIYLPLSTHSAKMNFGNVFNLETLLLFLSQYEDLIKGQNILVTEDNSNSGQTAQMIYEALMTLGARSVHVSFVEIDPHRVMYKQSSTREKKSEYVSNYLHPDFKSAVGVLPVARHLRQDYQLRKMYVWRLFNSYKKNE